MRFSSASRAHKLRLASVGALGPSTAEGSWKAEPRLPDRLYPSLIDWQAHTPWWIAGLLAKLRIRDRNVTLHRQHGADVLADFRKQIVLSLDAQLPLPSPPEQTQHAEAGGERRECGGTGANAGWTGCTAPVVWT